MKISFSIVVSLFLMALAQPIAGQDLPDPSPVVKEHEFLKRFVGTWQVESKGDMGDGSGPIIGKATMKSSMLGQLWLINSSEHSISGMKMKSIQMIGFDAKKKKYVGIWADSLVNHMWHYEGTVDASGNKLVLNAKGPSMTDENAKEMVEYRDAYEFKDEDTIIATSSMKGEDGKWVTIMKGSAKRVKVDE